MKHKELKKLSKLEVKLAQYQAQFGELSDDDTAKTPQERGEIERRLKAMAGYAKAVHSNTQTQNQATQTDTE